MKEKKSLKKTAPAFRAGDVCYLKNGTYPEHFAVICGVEEEYCHIMPGSFWDEMATANDVYLPCSALGNGAFVAVDTLLSMPVNALQAAFARLPENVFTALRNAWEALEYNAERVDCQLEWGIPCPGSHSERTMYRDEMISMFCTEQQKALSASDLNWDSLADTDQGQAASGETEVIPFPSWLSGNSAWDQRLAADSRTDQVELCIRNSRGRVSSTLDLQLVGTFSPFIPSEGVSAMDFVLPRAGKKLIPGETVLLFCRSRKELLGRGTVLEGGLIHVEGILCPDDHKVIDSLQDLVAVLDRKG